MGAISHSHGVHHRSYLKITPVILHGENQKLNKLYGLNPPGVEGCRLTERRHIPG
jgi:hypothetical protein